MSLIWIKYVHIHMYSPILCLYIYIHLFVCKYIYIHIPYVQTCRYIVHTYVHWITYTHICTNVSNEQVFLTHKVFSWTLPHCMQNFGMLKTLNTYGYLTHHTRGLSFIYPLSFSICFCPNLWKGLSLQNIFFLNINK